MTRTLKIEIHAGEATCVDGRSDRCRFLVIRHTGSSECLLFGEWLQTTEHLTGSVVRCVECLEAEVEP